MRSSAIKFAVGIMLVLSSFEQVSAQSTDFTQYYLNMPSINPGFTGIEDFTDMKMSFRQGWSGFGAKSSNYYISAYGALRSSTQSTLRNNSIRISDPSVMNELHNRDFRKKLRRKHGIGGAIDGEDFGAFKAAGFTLNYAYHLPLFSKYNFAMGTAFAYRNRRVNFGGFTVRDEINDIFYQQLIQSGNGNDNTIKIDFGASIYTDDMYFAISSFGMVSKKINEDNGFKLENFEGYSFQMGKIFKLSSALELNAGTKFDYSDLYKFTWTVNTRLRYNKILYGGFSYQSAVKLSGIVGLSRDGKYSLNYGYDFYTSSSDNFRVVVHEVAIGISLFNKNLAPVRLW